MADNLSAIPVAGAWWSAKPPAVALTLVTQLSANRAAQLLHQCSSWPGPISAAMYIAIPAPHAKVGVWCTILLCYLFISTDIPPVACS